MNLKIKLYTVLEESAHPQLLNPFFCNDGDTYADLRLRLESGGCIDWPFQFWDFDEHCRIRRKFEALNPVLEWVYIIPKEDEHSGRLLKRSRLDSNVETGSNDVVAPTAVEFPTPDVPEFEDAVLPVAQESEESLGVTTEEVVAEDEIFGGRSSS